MTEENSTKVESTTESTKATPGQQLKQGREAMGLTQQQVADRLHLRLGNIQDIETDTHQPGVSITFTKGYVRIYAKLLSMPVEPLLETFDILHKGDKEPAKLQSFSQRVAKQANDDRWMMVTYLIVFLVVASLVIWWYQQSDSSIMNRLNLFSDTTTESRATDINEGESVSAMQNTTNLPDELAIPEEDVKQQSTLSNPRNSLDVNAQQIKESANTGAVNTVSTLSEKASQSPEQASNDFSDANDTTDFDSPAGTGSREIVNGYVVNADGTVDVIFTFKEDCWLSVTDVNQEVKAVGVKVKGRVMSISGLPPISVNMCPPENVEIDFAGAPVDLTSYSRGIPIQFELAVTED